MTHFYLRLGLLPMAFLRIDKTRLKLVGCAERTKDFEQTKTMLCAKVTIVVRVAHPTKTHPLAR